MASLTIHSGRRCTKVRRAVNPPSNYNNNNNSNLTGKSSQIPQLPAVPNGTRPITASALLGASSAPSLVTPPLSTSSSILAPPRALSDLTGDQATASHLPGNPSLQRPAPIPGPAESPTSITLATPSTTILVPQRTTIPEINPAPAPIIPSISPKPVTSNPLSRSSPNPLLGTTPNQSPNLPFNPLSNFTPNPLSNPSSDLFPNNSSKAASTPGSNPTKSAGNSSPDLPHSPHHHGGIGGAGVLGSSGAAQYTATAPQGTKGEPTASLGLGPIVINQPIPVLYTSQTVGPSVYSTVIPTISIEEGSNTSQSTISIISPAESGTDGLRDAGSNNTSIIAGVISTVVIVFVILGVFVICAKTRKRQSMKTLASSSSSTKTISPPYQSDDEIKARPRSPTPVLEAGLNKTEYTLSLASAPRSRASSESASHRQGALMPITSDLTRRPAIPSSREHRRSMSSTLKLTHSVLSNDDDNPFQDPNPRFEAGSQMLNSNPSGARSPAMTLRMSQSFPSPLQAIMMKSTCQNAGSTNLQSSDPFVDPGHSNVTLASITSNSHQHSTTLTAPRLVPQPLAAVQVMANAIPTMMISQHYDASDAPDLTPATSADHVHSPRSSSFITRNMLRRSNNAKEVNSSRPEMAGISSARRNSPSLQAPRSVTPHAMQNAAGIIHSHRDSSRSSHSSLSLSFPSSWGSPGPTRPGSYAIPTNIDAPATRNDSRVSDPFDLDLPELLAYAESDKSYSPVSISHSDEEEEEEEGEEGKMGIYPNPASLRRLV